MEDLVDKTRITVEVVGPSSKPAVTLSWQGMTAHGDFTPVETGQHQVKKTWKVFITHYLLSLNVALGSVWCQCRCKWSSGFTTILAYKQ